MRYLHICTTLIVLCLFSQSVKGQYTREVAPFPVIDNRGSVPFPFLGGINFPKPLLVDFDHDTRVDLFVADSWGKLAYFRNIGSTAQPSWSPITDRFGRIDIGTWFTLCDIDNDTDFDLFCDNRFGGVTFWKNQSIGQTIDFARIDTAYGDSSLGGFQTGINNTCAFADIDSDGDPDFFFGGVGGNLVLYRNIGTAVSAKFILESELYDSVFAFPQGLAPRTNNPNHGFSAITYADIDTDGDQDLFFGDIYNLNIYLFSNLGTPLLSNLTWTTQNYLATPTAGFNHPTFSDLNGDGTLDMVVGVAQREDQYNLRYYTNTGTPQVAAFALTDSAIIHTLDFGSSPIPATGDLDGDGDMDLLVGAESGTMNYLQNTRNIFTPSFVLRTERFAGINAGYFTAPALCDLDADGDLDLLIGNLSGQIEYWRNVGNKLRFVPQLVTNKLANIKVDQIAIPCPVDLNGDALIDLVVGEWDFNGAANLRLYQNTGSASSPVFTLVTPMLLDSAGRDITIPRAVDWDRDGKTDLILGSRLPSAVWYRNLSATGQFPDSLTLVAQVDTIPGHTDGARLAFAFADFDGDGDTDYFTGEDDGGLNYYRHIGSCCVGMRGNIDQDPDNTVNAVDLLTLIDHLFLSRQPLNCPLASNVDASSDGGIDISDVTWLIAHLYIDLQPLPSCP